MIKKEELYSFIFSFFYYLSSVHDIHSPLYLLALPPLQVIYLPSIEGGVGGGSVDTCSYRPLNILKQIAMTFCIKEADVADTYLITRSSIHGDAQQFTVIPIESMVAG